MENRREAAKRVLSKLNEIQPALNGAGLDYESDLVRGMKTDMAVLIWNGKPDPVIITQVMDSQFSDVMGSMDYFLACLEKLGQLNRKALQNSDNFTELLRLAMYSAENFAARTGDLLKSKQLFQHLGDDNATN
jgi:hypothetical protein